MSALEEKIGYHFHDSALLALALTHSSVVGKASNQRLEFLGDAVLGLVITKILYDMYPAELEGELARRRVALVRGETLAQVAREIGLGQALHVSASEMQAGGCNNDSTLEDTLEALIGAIYSDGGLAAAEAFIDSRWRELAQRIVAPPKDAKTALQEWAQGRGLPIPKYTLIRTTGPAHAPEFTVEVKVESAMPVQAKAASKRAAEQAAAETLLKKLS